MDLVEAEEQQSEPPDDKFAEIDPTGRFLRYDEMVGSGTFKTVYKAFDKLEGIEVAWSQARIQGSIMESSKKMEQLDTEIQLLKSLRHKNIVRLFASWVDEEQQIVNIITELFTSGSLREYRAKHKKVGMKAMRRWAEQILAGLEYLHGQEPPIVHRDLKCANIFINGNHGEVKIGDFGLATVMQHGKVQSIKGTIEFMAPELFSGNYNELVDVYSFGMCMLEMVTCEYPYSECPSIVHIYKNVSQGKKPAALSKVEDAGVRSIIEICLASAADRLPASELLKRFFLQTDGSSCKGSISVPPLHSDPNPEPDSIFVSLVENDGQQSASLVLQKGEFLLKGNMKITNPVDLLLRMPDPSGGFMNVEFPLDVDDDTSLSVATEMVEQLELPQGSTSIIAELIDSFLLNLIPGWRPCIGIGQMVIEGEESVGIISTFRFNLIQR